MIPVRKINYPLWINRLSNLHYFLYLLALAAFPYERYYNSHVTIAMFVVVGVGGFMILESFHEFLKRSIRNWEYCERQRYRITGG